MANRPPKHRAVMDLGRDEWLDALGDRPRQDYRIHQAAKPLSVTVLVSF